MALMLPTNLREVVWVIVHLNIKASYSGAGVGVGKTACQVSWTRGFVCWQRLWRRSKQSLRRNHGIGIQVDQNDRFSHEPLFESASLWVRILWHDYLHVCGPTCWVHLWPKVGNLWPRCQSDQSLLHCQHIAHSERGTNRLGLIDACGGSWDRMQSQEVKVLWWSLGVAMPREAPLKCWAGLEAFSYL